MRILFSLVLLLSKLLDSLNFAFEFLFHERFIGIDKILSFFVKKVYYLTNRSFHEYNKIEALNKNIEEDIIIRKALCENNWDLFAYSEAALKMCSKQLY